MGNILTEEQFEELQSEMEGINPSSLAEVIRHALEGEGKHVPEEFCVHFMPDPDGTEVPMVFFWQDKCPTQQMTKKNFLRILEYVGDKTLEKCPSDANDPDTLRLTLAMEALRKELNNSGYKAVLGIETLTIQPSERERNDSGFAESPTCTPMSPQLLTVFETNEQEPEVSRSSPAPQQSDESDDVFTAVSVEDVPQRQPLSPVRSFRQLYNARRPKGIAGVVSRLPELRSRHSESSRRESIDSITSFGSRRMRDRLLSLGNISTGSRDHLLSIIDIESDIVGIKRREST